MREKIEHGVPPGIRQKSDGWHIAVGADGEVHVFATRDEAIAYSTATFADIATAARAEAQWGDVVQTEDSAPSTAQTPELDNEGFL